MRKVLIGSLVTIVSIGAIYGAIVLVDTPSAKPADATATAPKISEPPRPTDPNAHDYSDVDYAKKKLLHHQLAVQLADKAKADATSPEIKAFAATVGAQETERANAYAALLTEWGEKYMNITDYPEVNGCHGYPTFTGMPPVAEVGAYRLSSGAGIDTTFIDLLVKHHEGAEELSKYEGTRIGNAQLVSLNDTSLKDYSAEKPQLEAKRQSLGA